MSTVAGMGEHISWDQRLRQKLEELGWSTAELGRRMGKPDQAFLERLYKYVRGEVKNPRGDLLDQIAAVVGLTGPQLRYGFEFTDDTQRYSIEIKILGEVAAGVWKDVQRSDHTEFERDDSPFPPDPRYPVETQYDLIVRGTSINRVAMDGYRLRCVDVHKAGLEVHDGDLVIVERRRDGGHLIETTAKRVRRRRGKLELWPDSDDPQWQEPILYGEDKGDAVQIQALVIYAYRPVRT